MTAADSLVVTARTIEWAAQPLNAMYVVVPRGQKQRSWLPDGTLKGKTYVAEYGYVGIAVEQPEFVMEGINEAGLGAGLFYFPEYGEYVPYDEELKDFIQNALTGRMPHYSKAKHEFCADELEDRKQIQNSVKALKNLLKLDV